MIRHTLKKSIATLVFKPFFYIYSTQFVRNLINKKSRKLHENDNLRLNPVQTRVVEDMKKEGIAIASLKELFPHDDVLPRLQQYAESLRSQGVVDKGKPFLTYLWREDMTLDLKNPFVPMILSPNIIEIINTYLGVRSKTFYSSLNVTTPVPQNSPAFRSQNWHRDPEDLEMCKVFIYLNDVNEDSGPFVYIRKTHNTGKWGNLFPQKRPKGSYPSDEEVKKSIPTENMLVCTGKAGTVIFADTEGLHRGGYARKNERLMFTGEFATLAAMRSVRFKYANDILPKLSPLGRFAVSAKRNILGNVLGSISDFALKRGLY